MSWSDLAGARVGLWGTGVEGAANLRALRAIGTQPSAVVDDRPGAALPGSEPALAVGAGGLEALAACEVVVKSPGVPRPRPEVSELEAAGVAVTGGMALWLAGADRDRVVCVTGTKGKSTTTAVAGHLAAGLGRRPFVGGNLGRPPWDPEAWDPGADLWVVEVSSYQAADVAVSPPVVAVTSLHPDHLDWHGGEEAYYRDKLSLCSQPGAQLTVANGDDELLVRRRGLLGPRVEWVRLPPEDPGWLRALGLLGAHNRRNALVAAAALAAAGVAGADQPAALARAAAGFAGLPSRLRPIGAVGGVLFVDDSLSTNVLPTLAALEVFAGRRVALLVGGHDRGVDYRELSAALTGRLQPTLVLALPETGARVAASLGEDVLVRHHDDLGAATRDGWEWAVPDGVVLLSPAAASFGRFRDYRDRAEVFAAAMRACGPVSPVTS